MSFFGMGRPQPSSAEKIAAVEQEMKLMASMHNRYVILLVTSHVLYLISFWTISAIIRLWIAFSSTGFASCISHN